MRLIKRWWWLSFIVVVVAGVFMTAGVYAAPPASPPSGWQSQTLDNQVTFSYPDSFVMTGDGSPNIQIAGAALLTPSKLAYELTLGVELNQVPGVTVASETQRLLSAFGTNRLIIDNPTSLGQELEFHLSDGSTYTVILAPINTGVREVLIDNEHSDAQFCSTIQTFLSTIHNVTPIGSA